ncbi:ABC-type proline/glycine betaine transport system ATPase subunit [Streptomyces turgidiscabies]|uniref:ABC-type proline/glycine betaine transport system ATPase subunit n=1 Tax=Streptomyces turgidiscabies TaxID=85558 RepID=A0ABU0RSN8_9ACTN|nr:ABC-type proline/glycine betaine transport system ATPase subunit [Streptomyces turgidiscabies]
MTLYKPGKGPPHDPVRRGPQALPQTAAVHDLTLRMPEGGVTALVGSSGCGKTTTLRMINRMLDPTSGTIKVNGKDVLQQDAVDLRRSIGYVIQQSGLFPHRTVLDNIATVPLLLGWGRKKARARAAGAAGDRRPRRRRRQAIPAPALRRPAAGGPPRP